MENILIEKQDAIAIVTINRPTKLNALNKATIQELHDGFKSLNEDKSVKAIIVTGSGEKAFVAGADISEFANFSVEEGGKLAAEGQRLLFDFVQNLSTPVIAAVNGFALGGGLELAMSCHFRVASDNAKMGLPEVTLGVIPGYGGTQRLTLALGKAKAMEMCLTARQMDATEAEQSGLVARVLPKKELLAYTLEAAEKIAQRSLTATMMIKETINRAFEVSLSEGLRFERRTFHSIFATQDQKEGMQAFVEKRAAQFNNQ